MTKIAIIEDDHTISQMYRMKFESDGYDVQVAENGKVGIQLVEDWAPDIVLLDLMMPEMNGDESLREIRSKDWGKTVPIIILTNMGKEEAPRELEALNVSDYIVKAEMTPRQVVDKVKRVLGL